MKCIYLFCFVLTLGLLSQRASANNLTITNAVRLTPYSSNLIQFTVKWDNSWYVTGMPNNNDAIWVFIKFRPCSGGVWEHALLSTTMGDHTLGADLAFANNIVVTNRFGTGTGNNTGAMIRRAATGIGNIPANVCTLKISGSSSGATFDPNVEYNINIVGIEMVQVKSGSFYLGDGTSTSGNYVFGPAGTPSPNPTVPLQVTNEVATMPLAFNPASTGYSMTVPANYPKGYNEFYCMKYEITQGQYADFLNMNATASARYFSTVSNMYAITNAGVYSTTQKNRACNFLSFQDVMSYLDWAALRPMSEMEYEKACRGSLDPVPGEWAFGTGTPADLKEALSVTGATTGTEVCVSGVGANCHYAGTSNFITGGMWPASTSGPVESGIFARDNTVDRLGTGASYWGIMELSGNVWEPCVQVNTTFNSGTTNTGSTYDGQWGDGMLSAAGLYNTTNWPLTGTFYVLRGGSFIDNDPAIRVSYRGAHNQTDMTSRVNSYGGRGVR